MGTGTPRNQEGIRTVAFAAPQVVQYPQRAPLPYGLFSVFTPRPGSDDLHWMNGIEWEALTCDPVSGTGIDCEDALGLPKSFADGGSVDDASAFNVYGSYVCSPVGRTLSEAQERATLHLLAREEAGVENALWTGALGNTPNLQGATDLTAAGAVDVVNGIGQLEDFLATEYGSLGVIHMTRSGLITATAALAVVRDGQRMFTQAGTPVVAGAGYPGTSPAAVAPDAGETWMYVTPALFGYRSDVITSSNRDGDLLDRGTNDLHAVAERTYVLGWDDCGVAAVNVTQGCCGGSGGVDGGSP